MDTSAIERKNKLLYDKAHSKITEAEFYLEIAYWAMADGFEELRLKPLPSPPILLREYRSLSRERQQKADDSL